MIRHLRHDFPLNGLNLALAFEFTFNHHLQLLQPVSHRQVSLMRHYFIFLFPLALPLLLHDGQWHLQVRILSVPFVVLAESCVEPVKSTSTFFAFLIFCIIA